MACPPSLRLYATVLLSLWAQVAVSPLTASILKLPDSPQLS